MFSNDHGAGGTLKARDTQMSKLVAGAALAALMVAPALAQEACPAAGEIAALSRFVLEKRTELPRLQARGFGAEAAYLTLRYAPLEGEAARTFITDLMDEDIRGFNELAFAFLVATEGLGPARAALGDDASLQALTGTPSGARATIVFDTPQSLLDGFAELGDEGARVPLHAIYAGLLDLPDDVKNAVAALGEARGHVAVAGALYATMQDESAWPDYLARLPDAGLAEVIGNMWSVLPAFVGNAPLPSPDTTSQETWSDIYEILRLATLQPEVEFINLYFNHTGLIDGALTAARALHAAIEDGAIARDGTMDAGWLLTYRTILGMGDRFAEEIDPMLRGSNVGPRPLRQTAAETMDWIIAVDALTPYLKWETEDLPAAPHAPGGTLEAEWAIWQELAIAARTAPAALATAGDERRAAIAAEIVYAMGANDALRLLIENLPPTTTSVGMADDFARRLDRQCASYLWHMAESVVLAGTPVYKFDDAGVGFVLHAAPTEQQKRMTD